jgi:hypothetical protein
MSMTLIEKRTLDSTVSSIEFTEIPQTYTDLMILSSTRATTDGVVGNIRFNGDTGNNFTVRRLEGNGSSVSTGTSTTSSFQTRLAAASSYTTNTFSNHSLYLPNYTGSSQKSISIDVSIENNSTVGLNLIEAGVWTGTAPITSILYFSTGFEFTAGSTIFLYGINRQQAIGKPRAVGGAITFANGYWIHTFNASGTFSTFEDLDIDSLVIGGGGGGGGTAADGWNAGGGGAGGVLYSPNQRIVKGFYPITVGAGGLRGLSSSSNNGSVTTPGNDGIQSSFGGLYVAVGGGGGGASSGLSGGQGSKTSGRQGGSGGGAGVNYNSSTPTGGSGTAGQGNVGGNGSTTGNGYGGGGGGAGGPGSSNVTGTGGGPGIFYFETTYSQGGRTGVGTISNAAENTGNGGDGAIAPANTLVNSANGGSGVVVIRYQA